MTGEKQLVFEVLFDSIDDLNNLMIVPVCQDQQPRMNEASERGDGSPFALSTIDDPVYNANTDPRTTPRSA